MECADVLLPVAPFTETSGSFVNAEGRVQSFHAVVKPLGETRPAWKVLRALADILGLPGFGFDVSTDVLAQALYGVADSESGMVIPARLSNASAGVQAASVPWVEPCVAPIYQLDGLVRRASSLQLTADAHMTVSSEVVA